jgi:hypothetical protein
MMLKMRRMAIARKKYACCYYSTIFSMPRWGSSTKAYPDYIGYLFTSLPHCGRLGGCMGVKFSDNFSYFSRGFRS